MSAIPLRAGCGSSGAARQRAARHRFGDVAGRLRGTLREWRRRSRERGQLAALDDRMLQDIGISRAEARFLARKPFWRE
jgi:uncharacterized protein YjiS (DUF1127 family)